MELRKLERKLERIKEKKRKLVRVLCCCFAIVTLFSVLIVFGVYQFDRFQVKKVFVPLIRLAVINDNIRYNKEQEATLRGYVDTTKFSKEIEELSNIREEEYYNNEDSFIAFLCTCPFIIKLPCLILAIPLAIAVSLASGILIIHLYVDLFKACSEAWQNLQERQEIVEEEIKKNKRGKGGSSGSGASREIKNLKFRRLDVKRIG